MKEYIIAGLAGYFILFGILYAAAVYASLEFNPVYWSEIGRATHAWFSLVGAVVGVGYATTK